MKSYHDLALKVAALQDKLTSQYFYISMACSKKEVDAISARTVELEAELAALLEQAKRWDEEGEK